MQHALDAFLSLAQRHPAAALAFVALIAFSESLAIVGTLVPAGIVMFGAGVLVGHGTLQVGWTLAIAAAGAVAGDALSYELGRRKQDQVRRWRVLQRYASHVGRAEDLVARHGAASIVIARFTGAVRAFVPLLAGLARMPAGRFYSSNVASALLWAPAHILPGIVFGASLHLAEQASARLAVLVLLIAAVIWLALGLARLTIRVLAPFARRVRMRVWRAVELRTAWWARGLRLLVDTGRPDTAALLLALAVLLVAMWLFLGIVEDVVTRDPLVIADQAVFTFFQQVRTHPVDRLMVGITEMGSVGVMLPLILVVGGALGVERCWRTAAYWVATAASSELLVQMLKRTLGRHRPLTLYEGVEKYSFPSGHATVSAVVLGFLVFLLSRGQSKGWKLAVGSTAAVYVALVGLSRLYLGAHWMSDVLGGFSFGAAAAALSATLYTQRGVDEPVPTIRLAAIAGVTMLASGVAWSLWRAPADLRRYSPSLAQASMTLQDWQAGGFRQLPAYRREIAGELNEPFVVQLACRRSAILAAMHSAGWSAAPGLTMSSVLQTLVPNPSIGGLPVLPKFDGGRASEIVMMKLPGGHAHTRDVLRLWRSDWQIGVVPIWYGAFYVEHQVSPNFSFLTQLPAPPADFVPVLTQAGLRLLNPTGDGSVAQPQLWQCH